MKLLLDENLPHDLRHFLPGHEVFTFDFMGWKGLENGDLLTTAARERFDVIITLDSGIQFQHNPATLPCSVVILKVASNKLSDLLPKVTALLNALNNLPTRSVVRLG